MDCSSHSQSGEASPTGPDYDPEDDDDACITFRTRERARRPRQALRIPLRPSNETTPSGTARPAQAAALVRSESLGSLGSLGAAESAAAALDDDPYVDGELWQWEAEEALVLPQKPSLATEEPNWPMDFILAHACPPSLADLVRRGLIRTEHEVRDYRAKR